MMSGWQRTEEWIIDSKGRTPLHQVAHGVGNAPQALKLLLTSPRIKVNAVDAEGTTALHAAAMADAVDSVDALLRAGADPTLGLTAPRRAWFAKDRAKRDVILPVGCTALQAAELVGAEAAAARLRA